jgi:hypothetical protein
MAGPLTYPPKVVIESTVDLPPELGLTGGTSADGFELIMLVIELVIGLLDGF